jgi:hypothetical protein
MDVSKKEFSPCPIDVTLSVIDGRWKGTILWRLLNGPIIRTTPGGARRDQFSQGIIEIGSSPFGLPKAVFKLKS